MGGWFLFPYNTIPQGTIAGTMATSFPYEGKMNGNSYIYLALKS
jgi:hypothetical protein